MKRVVVTGIGAITPLGNSKGEFWNGVLSGKNGIDYVTRFDTTEHRSQVGGEVKGFDGEKFMSRKEAARLPLFIQYAIAGAIMAREDAGINLDNIDPYIPPFVMVKVPPCKSSIVIFPFLAFSERR